MSNEAQDEAEKWAEAENWACITEREMMAFSAGYDTAKAACELNAIRQQSAIDALCDNCGHLLTKRGHCTHCGAWKPERQHDKAQQAAEKAGLGKAGDSNNVWGRVCFIRGYDAAKHKYVESERALAELREQLAYLLKSLKLTKQKEKQP